MLVFHVYKLTRVPQHPCMQLARRLIHALDPLDGMVFARVDPVQVLVNAVTKLFEELVTDARFRLAMRRHDMAFETLDV